MLQQPTNPMVIHNSLLGILLALGALVSCTSKTIHPLSTAPDPLKQSVPDNSFMDLKPDGRLRIVVPVLATGDRRVEMAAPQTEGNTITLRASNLIGYDTSHFKLEGRTDGRVRVRFVAAENNREGKSVPAPNPPQLPFAWPVSFRHVRLIYLTRSSQADHNMAIAAAKTLPALDSFTSSLQANPALCRGDQKVFCTWVPAGVAVRPE